MIELPTLRSVFDRTLDELPSDIVALARETKTVPSGALIPLIKALCEYRKKKGPP
jgi:hypothetical protein